MLRFWLEKVIYGLLVLCVGGVGSLTYFDAFVPQHAHPYHLTILEGPVHAHNPLPLPAGSAGPRLESQLATRPILMAAQEAIPGLAFFTQSTLSQGYVLTDGRIELCTCPALAGQLQTVVPAKPSALLLPPDKPPTIHRQIT